LTSISIFLLPFFIPYPGTTQKYQRYYSFGDEAELAEGVEDHALDRDESDAS
jgi:hypothetical protein